MALVPDAASATATVTNITTATVVKAAPGRVFTATVVVAGSGAGTVNNCAATGDAAAGNEVGALPTTVGPILFGGAPCDVGIVVAPGAGQTVAVSFA